MITINMQIFNEGSISGRVLKFYSNFIDPELVRILFLFISLKFRKQYDSNLLYFYKNFSERKKKIENSGNLKPTIDNTRESINF